MSTVIVYFSDTNNTKVAAEYLASKIGAALVRLEGKGRVIPPKGLMKISAKPLGDPWAAVEGFDRMILMSPIYAFSGVPEVRGFFDHADLKDMPVLVITNGAAPEGKISARVHTQYRQLIEKAHGQADVFLHHLGGEYKKFAGEVHAQQEIDGIFEKIQEWIK